MAFTKEQRQEFADIINAGLKQSDFDFAVTAHDISPIDSLGKGSLIKLEHPDNFFNSIFLNLSPSLKKSSNTFYHYKSVDIAKSILQNREIQVSNLLSNQENDFAEYSEFYKRLGLWYKFIPTRMDENIGAWIIDNTQTPPIIKEKDNILILCFTSSNINDQFWKNYCSDDNGVCLHFKFESFSGNDLGLTDFRSVVYDTGYMFEFVNYINYHLQRKYNKQLVVEGISRFSKFYKRAKYSWEDESRLEFDYNPGMWNTGSEAAKYFPLQEDTTKGRKFIKIPIFRNPFENAQFTSNPLFTLILTGITFGRNVGQDDYKEINQLLDAKFPGTTILRRN